MKLQFTLTQKIPYSETNNSFIVERGDSLYKVLTKLEEIYEIEDTYWVKLKYIFRASPVIKAGRYNIFRDSTLESLIDRFIAGDVEKFKFTIIEGTVASQNLAELEEILLENNLPFEVPKQVIDIFSSEASIEIIRKIERILFDSKLGIFDLICIEKI